jgi:hypothetical protein
MISRTISASALDIAQPDIVSRGITNVLKITPPSRRRRRPA